MPRNKLAAAMMVAAMLLLPILAGCQGERGAAGPPGTTLIQVGGMVNRYNQAGVVDFLITISECSSQPQLYVNQGSTPFTPYSTSPPYWLDGSATLPPDDSIHLSFTYLRADGSPGTARADIIMPDTFRIVSPEHSDSITSPFQLPLGSGLEVRWNASAGADAYYFHASMGFSYLDTAGLLQGHFLMLDTLITDTFYALTAAALFPDTATVDSVVYPGDGLIFVDARSGPVLPGDPDNVGGDGQGYINGETKGDYFWMVVQSQP